MSNKNLSTLYIGVKSNLEKRVLQHKIGKGSELTSKYKLTLLVYFEKFNKVTAAIEREKQLKNWHSDWKWNLIKSDNPELIDIASGRYDAEILKPVQGDDIV